MRRIKRSTQIGILALLVLVTQAQICDKSTERKLLKAQDNAAVLIQKAEQARTIALTEGRIDQATASNIDRALLRINTGVKKVSAASDAYYRDPAGTGTGSFRDAMRGLRTALDEVETSIKDGTLGIKNPDSQKTFVALVDSLRATAAVVEGIIAGLEKK